MNVWPCCSFAFYRADLSDYPIDVLGLALRLDVLLRLKNQE